MFGAEWLQNRLSVFFIPNERPREKVAAGRQRLVQMKEITEGPRGVGPNGLGKKRQLWIVITAQHFYSKFLNASSVFCRGMRTTSGRHKRVGGGGGANKCFAKQGHFQYIKKVKICMNR